MAGRPYPGYVYPPHYQPPPPGPPGAHPPYMATPGFVVYPFNPMYYYPPPPPANEDGTEVDVVDVVEDEVVPELPGELVKLPYSTYRWVPGCTSQNSIPPGALRVGVDVDGAEIFAGRCHHEGDILPAKVIPSRNSCYVSFGGEEVSKDQFELLVPAMFSWQFCIDGEVPPGAVQAGVTADGEKLYFGRVTADGATTPGKIQPSHGCCYYPFDGEERNSKEYECLVLI